MSKTLWTMPYDELFEESNIDTNADANNIFASAQ
ncbi:hypothetical protein SCARD494_06219 [Seiridium cardinale]